MKFDIYGQFKIEIAREGDAWIAYLLEPGKRIRMHEVGIPAILGSHEIAMFLDDMYHEKSKPGQSVRMV